MINNLFIMLLELIENKKLTAKYLSERLSVSTRTIYRYIDELSLANIPISTVKGKNGGIFIGEEFKLNPIIFSKSELDILKNALKIYNKNENATNISIINNILSKLNYFSSIDSKYISDRKIMEYTTKREKVIIDKLNIFEYALINNKQVRIDYHDRSSKITTRTIYPYQLLLNENNWYIYAYCTLRKEFRAFKLSRITNINLTGKDFEPIENNVNGWKFNFKEEEKRINLVIKINSISRYDVEEWLGIESVTTKSDGTLIAVSSQIFDKELLYKLISFGDNIEILSPKSIQKQLIEITSNINKLYTANKNKDM